MMRDTNVMSDTLKSMILAQNTKMMHTIMPMKKRHCMPRTPTWLNAVIKTMQITGHIGDGKPVDLSVTW